MSVASLLNPFPMESDDTQPLPSPWTDRHSSVDLYCPLVTPSSTTTKKAKMSKDAPIFAKAKVKGEVRFPPWEEMDDPVICREMRRLSIYPLGRIQDYPRHIPYNSDKKSFLEKTGRESFEGRPPATYVSRL